MNLTEKQRRWVVLGIAGILIVLGLLEPLFKITLDRQLMDNLSFILMAAAAFLLFSRKRGGPPQDNRSPEENPPPKPEIPADEGNDNKIQ